MSFFNRLTPFTKILFVALILGGLYGGFQVAKSKGWLDSVIPKGKQSQDIAKGSFSNPATDEKLNRPIRVGVVTWGGYVGGQYFNGGFKASKESRYFKQFGIQVEFVLNDEFVPSRDAFKAGKVDVLWGTADSFPTEVDGLADQEPKIIFQADWSRGGDAIVVRRGINTVADLKGKKIAFAQGTPSNTFLLWMLDAGDLSYSDIEPVVVDSAVTAASHFKAGKVDAAIVWSPDDKDCVANVKDAKILKSTEQASHIIADVFFAKKSFIDNNKEAVKALIEGWMIGAAEINADTNGAKDKASKILSEGLNVPVDFAVNAISKARLTTFGDNMAFFDIKPSNSVKGEGLYTTMSGLYAKLNLAPSKVPSWKTVTDTSLLKTIQLDGEIHDAEKSVKFSKVTEELKTTQSFSSKKVSISFASGSSTLDENAKYIVQAKFGEIAKSFAHARVRIEGNTDNVGSVAMNKSLSSKRAKAVADFLIQEYNFDPNRFVIVGNGDTKPIAPNDSDSGRSKNRRTDFELLD